LLLAGLHDILLTLHNDLTDGDGVEAIRYTIHSLLRLVVKVAAALKVELGISPSSQIAAMSPDIEGERWEF
jgi:hypothetical protein